MTSSMQKHDDVGDAKRILREITLLRQMNHENIVNIVPRAASPARARGRPPPRAARR